MFPLGTVLFPYGVLPLHVFEPRYRLLAEHCLAGDGCFGVVLIERGSEVGGGDTRFDVGTRRADRAGRPAARRAVRARDRRHPAAAACATGCPTIRTRRPRSSCSTTRRTPATRRPAARAVRRGRPPPAPRPRAAGRARRARTRAEVELTVDDLTRAAYEAAALAPLGPLDAQALLELDDPVARLARLEDQLTDEARLLEFRLSRAEAARPPSLAAWRSSDSPRPPPHRRSRRPRPCTPPADARVGADADPGPDRDRVALEALEAELAVLEDELARVDRGRAEGPGHAG